MQIRVKADSMLQVAENMRELEKKLNACESELAQIGSRLTDLSGMELPIERIRQCAEQVEMESRYSILFGTILTDICRLYQDNENKLVDFSENVRRKARRESFSNQNLRGLQKILSQIFL